MLEYSVGSSMDRDDLYAELSFNRVQWGEIALSQDRKSINITIYPDTDSNLIFNYSEFISLIEKAKQRLLEVEGIKNL